MRVILDQRAAWKSTRSAKKRRPIIFTVHLQLGVGSKSDKPQKQQDQQPIVDCCNVHSKQVCFPLQPVFNLEDPIVSASTMRPVLDDLRL